MLPLLLGVGSRKRLGKRGVLLHFHGEFHFPNEQAAQIAVETVKKFLKTQTSVKKVIFNVFKDLDKAIYEKLLGAA